jgi:hypothetical protein
VLHGVGIPRRVEVSRGKRRGAERRRGSHRGVCAADCVEAWSVMDCE